MVNGSDQIGGEQYSPVIKESLVFLHCFTEQGHPAYFTLPLPIHHEHVASTTHTTISVGVFKTLLLMELIKINAMPTHT